jgi:hypothetical protein
MLHGCAWLQLLCFCGRRAGRAGAVNGWPKQGTLWQYVLFSRWGNNGLTTWHGTCLGWPGGYSRSRQLQLQHRHRQRPGRHEGARASLGRPRASPILCCGGLTGTHNEHSTFTPSTCAHTSVPARTRAARVHASCGKVNALALADRLSTPPSLAASWRPPLMPARATASAARTITRPAPAAPASTPCSLPCGPCATRRPGTRGSSRAPPGSRCTS